MQLFETFLRAFVNVYYNAAIHSPMLHGFWYL